MFKTLNKAALVLSAIAIASTTAIEPVQAQDKAMNIGVVEMQEVLQKHPRIKKLESDLKTEEDRLHKMIERSNKDFQVARKNKKPEAELKTLRKTLQSKIDKEVQTYQQTLIAKEKKLRDELYSAIQAEAKAKNLDTVIKKSAILVGGVDITDGVVKRISSATAKKASK